MTEAVATVTSKGQITLPVAVRRALGIRKGTQVRLVLDAEGGARLIVPRYSSIESLRGAAGTLKHPMPWSEVEDIAREDGVHLKASNAGA